jgi:hypothetical protein
MNSVKTTSIKKQAHGVGSRLAARAGTGSHTGTGMVVTAGATPSYGFYVGDGAKSAAGRSTYQVCGPKDSRHMFIGVEGN